MACVYGRSFLSCLVACILFLGVPALARGQSSETDLLARLRNKPLFLKGSFGQDQLRFDHAGKPLEDYAVVSFTLAAVDLYRAKFKDGGLELSGQRMGIEFVKPGQARRVELYWPGYGGDIRIFIQGKRGDDFGPALDAIFAPDMSAMLPLLPPAWELVAQQLSGQQQRLSPGLRTNPEASASSAATSPEAPHNPASAPAHSQATPPKLLGDKKPHIPQAASELHYGRTVEVYLWVDAVGKPSHLRIVQPAGLGLDEEALAAVSQYKFAPATLDGSPVGVDLYIELSF